MRCEHHNEAGKLKSIDRFGIAEMVSPEILASELRYSYEDDQTEVVFIVNGVLWKVCVIERERELEPALTYLYLVSHSLCHAWIRAESACKMTTSSTLPRIRCS
jgi:hypothetical protein